MIVQYQGPDTNNKKELIEGAHDGEIEQPKDLKKEEYNEGFKAEYFFFSKGTN